jgi:hypothetical protein
VIDLAALRKKRSSRFFAIKKTEKGVFKVTEKILRVNSQTSGNALVINTCNDFNNMNVPTIQPISLDDDGKLKYRSQGGLVGIYTEKALNKIIAGLESLRSHVKAYEEAEAKRISEASAKKKEASAEVDEKTMKKALQTLISVGHTEAEARRILKIEDKQEDDDLPEDIKVTLQVLLDKGMPKQEAYKKLGLTKQGKVDKRKKR